MRTKSKIQRGGDRPPVLQLIRRHCVPLHAVATDKSSEGKLNITGGSALLVETICGRFFVTASHVWQELIKLTRDGSEYRIVCYDLSGPVLIQLPRLIDESEELDIAVFTVQGIAAFNPTGKAFLQTANVPSAPAQSGEMIVGCGYPGAFRKYENGNWKLDILGWAHRQCTISESGRLLLLDGHSGRGKVENFSTVERKEIPLPGISGAPLFALRDTLDWVGVVRSGCGTPPDVYSIQATPSSFVNPDGRIHQT
jgi:hypothetical protein